MQCLCREDIGSFGTPFVNSTIQRRQRPIAKHAEIRIGKFDIQATYTYVKALLDGTDDSEAKERGIVAPILGAKAKSGIGVDHKAEKTAAEKKKKTTITAEEFEHQVAAKMGAFFEKTFRAKRTGRKGHASQRRPYSGRRIGHASLTRLQRNGSGVERRLGESDLSTAKKGVRLRLAQRNWAIAVAAAFVI
jgi:hypothetical protein